LIRAARGLTLAARLARTAFALLTTAGRDSVIDALAFDAPWTTRACADYVAFTPEWIRVAITKGVVIDGKRVKLEAETVTTGARRIHRVHVDKFADFLSAIGWTRLPARRCDDDVSRN
jgi:hypothetical protein